MLHHLILMPVFHKANAKSTPGPAEWALTNSVCGCLTKVDLNKVNNKQDVKKLLPTVLA